MGVHIVYGKGNDAAVARRLWMADDMHMGKPLHSLHDKGGKTGIIFFYSIQSYLADIVNGGGKPHRPGDIHRARLEFMRQLGIGNKTARHVLYHLAARKEWRHCLEKRFLSI